MIGTDVHIFCSTTLEYCDSVWDNASVESKKQLDDVHISSCADHHRCYQVVYHRKTTTLLIMFKGTLCCCFFLLLFFAIDNNTNSESWLIRQTHVCPVFSLVTYQGRCLLIKIKKSPWNALGKNGILLKIPLFQNQIYDNFF